MRHARPPGQGVDDLRPIEVEVAMTGESEDRDRDEDQRFDRNSRARSPKYPGHGRRDGRRQETAVPVKRESIKREEVGSDSREESVKGPKNARRREPASKESKGEAKVCQS